MLTPFSYYDLFLVRSLCSWGVSIIATSLQLSWDGLLFCLFLFSLLVDIRFGLTPLTNPMMRKNFLYTFRSCEHLVSLAVMLFVLIVIAIRYMLITNLSHLYQSMASD